MSSGSPCADQQPVTSSPTAVPEIVNWPVQKRKMWRGKGHLPTWTELRRAASGAIDEALKTNSLEQLVDIVKPCREACLKTARNKRDKNAHVKREYHNMVMDLLEGLVKQQQEMRERDAAGQILAGDTPVTCRCSRVTAERTDGVATAAGRGTERLNVQQMSYAAAARMDDPSQRVESSLMEAQKTDKKPQGQPHWDLEAQYPHIPDIPQHTGFYAGLFRGLFNPRVAQTGPTPETRGGASYEASNGEGVTTAKGEWNPQLERVEETYDADLKEWVDVEEDLVNDWVSVAAKKP